MTITATIAVLPVLLAGLTLIAMPWVRRRAEVARRRPLTLATLLVYAAAVATLTVFPIDVHPPDFWAHEPWWSDVHWIPFYVDAPSMILNVIMFVPCGILVPLLWPAVDTTRKVAAVALAASASVELTQLVLALTLHSRRTVDVNDLLANVGGALLGLLLLRLSRPAGAPRRPPARPSADLPVDPLGDREPAAPRLPACRADKCSADRPRPPWSLFFKP